MLSACPCYDLSLPLLCGRLCQTQVVQHQPAQGGRLRVSLPLLCGRLCQTQVVQHQPAQCSRLRVSLPLLCASVRPRWSSTSLLSVAACVSAYLCCVPPSDPGSPAPACSVQPPACQPTSAVCLRQTQVVQHQPAQRGRLRVSLPLLCGCLRQTEVVHHQPAQRGRLRVSLPLLCASVRPR